VGQSQEKNVYENPYSSYRGVTHEYITPTVYQLPQIPQKLRHSASLLCQVKIRITSTFLLSQLKTLNFKYVANKMFSLSNSKPLFKKKGISKASTTTLLPADRVIKAPQAATAKQFTTFKKHVPELMG